MAAPAAPRPSSLSGSPSWPTGPPPRTSSRRGTAFIAVASRLVQIPSSSRRPGTGGTTGSAPFARTTCSAVWRTPSTSTTLPAVSANPTGVVEGASGTKQVAITLTLSQPALGGVEDRLAARLALLAA